MTSQDPSRVPRIPEFAYSSPPRAIERAMKTSTEDVHVAGFVGAGCMHRAMPHSTTARSTNDGDRERGE